MHFWKKIKIQVNIVLIVLCLELGAVVDDSGTCNLTCRAGSDKKQQESHSEAHKLLQIAILGDLIRSEIFN